MNITRENKLNNMQTSLSGETKSPAKRGMIWANLLHLGTNMWEDHAHVEWPGVSEEVYRDDFECKTCSDAIAWGVRAFRSYLVFDDVVWDKTLKEMARAGMNMLVIDLGDAVRYRSHPEIAVKNAWTVDRLRAELDKIRKLGLEPIPELNFATSHDTWLGEYAKMVSTSKYYQVCSDLISEVIELFDTPRFFHLGMDEETEYHQKTYEHSVIRQHDLWWHDLYFYIDETEKKGVRSWIWSDYGWRHPELFFRKMPKSVVQSNWYYEDEFDLNKIDDKAAFAQHLNKTCVQFYKDLEYYGYDQIPTGSNWNFDSNMEGTVKFCQKNIDPARLLGFMTAPWLPTLDICLNKQIDAIRQIEHAKKKFYP